MEKSQNHEGDERLKNDRTWFGFISKILFIISAIIVLILAVFANMGGNSDALKSGVAQFASRLFENRPATVDRLVNMRFFPTIGVDAEGINVQPFIGSAENLVSLKKVKFFMSFWDVFLGSQAYKVLYLSDLIIKENVWGDRSLKIETLSIQHDVASKEAELVAKGKIGVYDWSVNIGMDVAGVGGDYRYSFSQVTPLNFEIADIHLMGSVMRLDDGFITIKDFSIKRKNKAISGDVSIFIAGDNGLQIKGRLKANDEDGILTFNTHVARDKEKRPTISGELKGVSLKSADIYGENSLPVFWGRVAEVLSLSDLKFPLTTLYDYAKIYDLDLSLDLQAFEHGSSKENQVSFSVRKYKDYARVSKISGRIEGTEIKSPDLYLVSNDNGFNFILSGGKVNFSLYKYLGLSPAVYPLFEKNNDIETECTVGLYQEPKGVTGLVAKNKSGQERFGVDIPVLPLKSDSYDFISDSLKSSDQNSPCLSFISLIPAEKKEEKISAGENKK